MFVTSSHYNHIHIHSLWSCFDLHCFSIWWRRALVNESNTRCRTKDLSNRTDQSNWLFINSGKRACDHDETLSRGQRQWAWLIRHRTDLLRCWLSCVVVESITVDWLSWDGWTEAEWQFELTVHWGKKGLYRSEPSKLMAPLISVTQSICSARVKQNRSDAVSIVGLMLRTSFIYLPSLFTMTDTRHQSVFILWTYS